MCPITVGEGLCARPKTATYAVRLNAYRAGTQALPYSGWSRFWWEVTFLGIDNSLDSRYLVVYIIYAFDDSPFNRAVSPSGSSP